MQSSPSLGGSRNVADKNFLSSNGDYLEVSKLQPSGLFFPQVEDDYGQKVDSLDQSCRSPKIHTSTLNHPSQFTLCEAALGAANLANTRSLNIQ